MTPANELVSVVIPAYNAGNYVRQAIESVLGQTYTPIEVIVVDDGSTDDTRSIAESFGDKIIYLYQENQGLPAARNTGIKESKGVYISFLDADDIYESKKIEVQVSFLKSHPEYALAYCHMYHFYDGKPDKLYRHQGASFSGNVFKPLLYTFFGQADTLLIPRNIIDTVGLFNPLYKYAEDWEFNLRIAKAGFTFGFINEPLIRMRVGINSWSGIDKQVLNKEFHVRMFTELAATLTADEKAVYNTEQLISNAYIRLALANLLEGNKEKSIEAVLKSKSYVSNSRAKILYWLICIMPIYILKMTTRFLWKRNRKGLLKNV